MIASRKPAPAAGADTVQDPGRADPRGAPPRRASALPDEAALQRARLGQEIRSLRRARGITLAALAERVERSVGYLSQLERGQSEASIGVLQRIAQTLGVQVSWFFPTDDSAPAAERSVVVRRGNRRPLSFASGINEYLLSPNLSGKLEMVLSVLEPGADSGDAYTHEGEETGVVLRGRMVLWLDGEEFALEAGDSFAYPSQVPHRYWNPGTEVTETLWVVTPPTY